MLSAPKTTMIVGVLVDDQVHRLVDRVGAALVPLRAEPLLRRHRGDVVAEQRRHPPGQRDVPVERVRLVLGEHGDLHACRRWPGWTARSRSADSVPPNGTAGLARSMVSGISRLPSPPASTIASTFGRAAMAEPRLVNAIHGRPGSTLPTRASPTPCTQRHATMRHARHHGDRLRISLLTREYPPSIYGGAGVHVGSAGPAAAQADRRRRAVHGRATRGRHRARGELSRRAPTRRCGSSAPTSRWPRPCADGGPGALPHLVRQPGRPLTGLLHDIPHVVTAHSLEPHRPWKAEQLGGGYRLSSWAERTRSRPPTR